MGFSPNNYCKVWSIESINETKTKLRISTSRKNKQTGVYEQDFSGYVMCLGANAASKAANLQEGDRIKILTCDVGSRYVAETHTTYYDFKIFSFEVVDGSPAVTAPKAPNHTVDEGCDGDNGKELPF